MTARPELDLAPDAATVTAVIRSYRFTYSAETQLQEGVAAAFATAGVPAEREARLSPIDRIDFLIGRVGVEVKIAGSVGAVLGQLQRYALHDLSALVLVTTRARHLALPTTVGGLPLHIVHLGGAV
ncbi:MAG: hypothetical protein ACRDQX_02120 [Pseudonocardiaceae bacterium]